MYATLTINIPGICNAAEAREWFFGINHALFHHQPDNSPANGISPFRWGGGSGKAVLHAVGPDACVLLQEQMPTLLSFAQKKLGTPIWPTYSMKGGECTIKVVPYLTSGFIRCFVFRSDDYKEKWKEKLRPEGFMDEALLKQIHGRLVMGLQNQSQALLGVDCPHVTAGDYHIERGCPILVHDNRYLYGLYVRFRTNAQFMGPWHIGSLKNRGYGRVTNRLPE